MLQVLQGRIMANTTLVLFGEMVRKYRTFQDLKNTTVKTLT